ncbi:ACP S-malonyltransferase [Geobacter sp. SVR]|uniref:ACP S-malonyltransferase n=1 Tax=Geobacter sp. SVR TaxID=2495594 RepID=UPI00143EF4ED|nr:acyltransferase domain-containing protein [Geobacter sp. SVR]BCS54300.1 malonyl CoA-ACP transacylase [Geobacter sp. SVR]GCF85841.1 malonyl CoA-ACP transacylase [Geobacter sp. SVR]
MTCFMFPGQPMARTDLPLDSLLFDELAACCHTRTGFDPRHDSLADPALKESVRLQLFGVTVSLYRFKHLLSQGRLPDIVAEHSLGIYPALAACGSIDSGDALELTGRIGRCLAGMGTHCDYALGSVIGLPLDPLEDIAGRNGVHVANHNTSRHFLLAGERRRIEAATAEAGEAGAFSVGVFPCDAPLHTPLIEQIAGDLRVIIGDYGFSEPVIPLVDHLRQRLLSAEEIPQFLLEELCRPVFWERSYRSLRRLGATDFHEVGQGAALSKFNRWIDSQS